MEHRTLSGEEITRNLRAFVTRWNPYDGSEPAGGQTFVNELLACYGTDRFAAGVELEDARVSDGIVDVHWPGVCILEMKAPREAKHLDRHRRQALDYWTHSASVATGRPAPPYVVLCAFSRFEVWEPGRFPLEPRAVFSLEELPDRYDALLFLAGGAATPIFSEHRALTKQTTAVVGRLFRSLRDRRAEEDETLRNFVVQAVWCLFAENTGLIDGRPFERIVDRLRKDPSGSSAAELGHVFFILNQREHYGRNRVYEHLPYANGGLFADPAHVDLDPDELALLAEAAEFDWGAVEPIIFSSLMEQCLDPEGRSELGAHYTHESDIMKIVRPTIVEPWQRLIDGATTPAEAERVLADLCRFTVLDPACGCGNFLYVAYRELRRLERSAYDRIDVLARETGIRPSPDERPRYRIGNVHGIDVSAFAVKIARLTLWMGHKKAADEFGSVEPPLPLTDLSTIRRGDALRMPWPAVDAIVGNPPFLGSQRLRKAHDAAYVAWLESTFGCGTKDFCVYWFRKAHDRLAPGGRAGLVGTNSISQNRARSASLDYVVARGGVITDAVSTQRWPGEAHVHVSIVNWVKSPPEPPERFLLDGAEVSGITAELRPPERSTGNLVPLRANARRCFQGSIPGNAGFLVSAAETRDLLARPEADYAEVVRRYLTGEDIADDPEQAPRRWVVDFGLRPLEEAMRYPAALAVVRERVKPQRDANPVRSRREAWWRFVSPAVGMRRAVERLPRYVAGVAFGKRLLLCWAEPETTPSGKTYVFAFSDDYAMGILGSRAHAAWARSRGATLKADLSYTPTSVFETFPWPDPAPEHRERIGEASRRTIAARQEVCRKEDIGLTVLYNRMEEGAYQEVRAAHLELDEAVAGAYGWPARVCQDDDEIVRRLRDLHRSITAGERTYDPFGESDDGYLSFEP